MVSRAKFNCNIFTGNMMCYFRMWGNLRDKKQYILQQLDNVCVENANDIERVLEVQCVQGI